MDLCWGLLSMLIVRLIMYEFGDFENLLCGVIPTYSLGIATRNPYTNTRLTCRYLLQIVGINMQLRQSLTQRHLAIKPTPA